MRLGPATEIRYRARLRHADRCADAVEDACHAQGGHGTIHLDRHRLVRKVVEIVRRADAAPAQVGSRIDFVARFWNARRRAIDLRGRSPCSLAYLVQFVTAPVVLRHGRSRRPPCVIVREWNIVSWVAWGHVSPLLAWAA